MQPVKKTYYYFAIERYKKEGEDMIIWSIDNGGVERTKIRIKDLNDIEIKESIIKAKYHKCEPIKTARIEIFNDVLMKRRKLRIEKICSKLGML